VQGGFFLGKKPLSRSVSVKSKIENVVVAAPVINNKRCPIFGVGFVMHSLRHTMLTRLGESGTDAFTIMRIAAHSSVVVSQRNVHPTPETVERAFERLQLQASGSFALEASRLGIPAILPAVGTAVAVSH
jgi:integrase